MQHVGVGSGREQRYYAGSARGVDYVLRCKDCKALVTTAALRDLGCCECGNKRFAEITILNEAEHAQILAMDFPQKDAFLAEFAARG